jgi:hypothetical protein
MSFVVITPHSSDRDINAGLYLQREKGASQNLPGRSQTYISMASLVEPGQQREYWSRPYETVLKGYRFWLQ